MALRFASSVVAGTLFGISSCNDRTNGGILTPHHHSSQNAPSSRHGFFFSSKRQAVASAVPKEDDTFATDVTWGLPWDDKWDSPAASDVPAKKTVKRQIILIRHGQYANESHGHSDEERRLTSLGKEQAKETGRFLSAMLGGSNLVVRRSIAAVHVSTMTRAKETAEHILDNLQPRVPAKSIFYEDGLRECFPCDPQPPFASKKASERSKRAIEKAFHSLFYRPSGAPVPSSPSSPAAAAAANLDEASSVELVVAHGNVIRYFLCRALQVPPEAWLRFSLPHCSITSLTINGQGHVSVSQVGAVGHLRPELQTIHNVA